MSIMYLAQREISLTNPDGVCKKILSQAKVFSSVDKCFVMGYKNSDIVLIDENTSCVVAEHKNGMSSRDLLYSTALEYCTKLNTNIIYFRYGFSDKKRLDFLKRLHEKGITIIAEIPTYPYRKEAKGLRVKIIYNVIDGIYCRQLRKYVSRILTYTADKTIFGIPCINTLNGILVDEVKPRIPVQDSNEIHLIAVSSMEKWHGYERIIYGLNEYYSNHENQYHVVFDLVGDGKERKRYESIVEKYNLSQYVKFHGFQTGDKLDALYNQASIGVGTLSFFKTGVKSSSALKTREYLAKGIPMISGSKVDGLPDNYLGVLYCEENDNPINIEDIISFYHTIYDERSCTDVIQSFREDAIRYFDLNNMLKELCDYMNSVCNRR